MNYRHIYHAGNFADVIKHVALCLCLDRLKEKEKGFFVLDAHGGCGLYDLRSEQAQKTKEYEAGIARLFQAEKIPEDLAVYLDLVRQDFARHKYPGSPLIAARLLRPQDRMIANELHPEDVKTLRQTLGPRKNVQVTMQDAYECIRAHAPPEERRGLVLIDPPFEEKDEFETLCAQMKEWKKRWETGTYVIWYPIKAHLPVGELHDAAAKMGWNEAWVCEFLLAPREQPETLNGCGLLILNTPYQVPEKFKALSPFLEQALGGRMEITALS